MPKPISQVALGPQGAGVQGPGAAMQAVQQMAQMQQQTAQKATQNLQRIQAEGDARANAQAQQMAGAVADVANQVSGGIQKMYEEKKQRQEKVEDVKLQEDMMQFQQQLAQEAAAEGQRIGTMLKNSRDATLAATDVWREKKDQSKRNIDTAWARLNDQVTRGIFRDIPDGYKKFDEIWNSLKTAEAYQEDAFDPAYLSHAAKMLADAERDIVEGRDPMDLAALYDRPNTTDYKDIQADKMPALDGKTRIQMQVRDGYPKEGMMAMKADDPRRASVRVVTPDLMPRLVQMDAEYASMLTNESKEKWLRANLRDRHETLDRLSKMADNYEQVSDMLFSRSPGAIQMAIQNFTADPRPGKFDNVGENLGKQMIFDMFPESGPQMVEFAQGIRDRTIELDTPQEFSAAMTLEAAAAAIEKRANQLISLHTKTLEKGEKGELRTPMSEMTEQWARTNPAQASAVVGAENLVDGKLSAVGLAKGQFFVQGQLEKAAAWAGELRRSANSQGALAEFSKQFGTEMRVGEILTYKWLEDNAENRQKSIDLLYKQSEEGLKSRAAGMTASDLDNLKVAPTPEYEKSRSIIQSTLDYINKVKPSDLPLAAALLSGGQVDLSDGRNQTLNSATMNETQKNEYMAITEASLQSLRARRKAARTAAQGGTPWTPEQAMATKKRVLAEQKAHVEQVKAQRLQQGGAGVYIGRAAGGIAKNFRTGLDTYTEFNQAWGRKLGELLRDVGQGAQAGYQAGARPQQQPQQPGQPQIGP